MTVSRERYVQDRAIGPASPRRIGEPGNGCTDWEIYKEGYLVVRCSWEVYHPDVANGAMPNDGYFETWQQAMDFVDEYIRAAEWNSDLIEVEDTGAAWLPPVSSNAPNYVAARRELQ